MPSFMRRVPSWTDICPVVAGGLLLGSAWSDSGAVLVAVWAAVLIAAVLAAVHHAEVVAHRVGEPFGTLVLAVAVTVIEVALIVSVMLAGGADAAVLPRDTIYSAVMIITTGVAGICMLVGGWHHHEQRFQTDGANAALAPLVALATLSLVMPSFTTSSAPGTYVPSQLVFVAVSSLALWAVFVFVQTVRHRDYFLPPSNAQDEAVHAEPPGTGRAWLSFALLLVSLVAVVGLAKRLSPSIEAALVAAGAPRASLGIAIAMLVLLPETWAAVRAARADRLQTSLNLALGSALASIGLTIPVIVAAAVYLRLPLVLGLETKDIAMLALAFLVSATTLGTGRSTVMQGSVHLALFAAFLFLALVP